MEDSSLRERMRYRFDNLLARGTWAVLLWLGAVTLAAVLVSSVLLAVFGVDFAGSEGASWPEDFWQSLLRVLDPGTMAADVGWGRRLLALLVTVFGILVAGTLIGLIASGVEQRVEAMRRGRSRIVESDHVVILGASSRLPVIIDNLALANRGRRAKAIVVLADREPVELREDIGAATGDLHGSYLVVRRGDPTRAADLGMVALTKARAVLVLRDDAGGDGEVVTALLSVGAALERFDRVPIVAEITSADVAAQVERASHGAVHVVMAGQSNGRIAAFALGESGLNQVVLALLAHQGADISVCPTAAPAGSTFGELVVRCREVRPLGRLRPDGDIELAPPAGTRLAPGDRLIVLAEDDAAASRLELTPHAVEAPAWRPPAPATVLPHRVLVLGWNDLGSHLLRSLDEIALPGSSVDVVVGPRSRAPNEDELHALRKLAVTVRTTQGPLWELGDDVDTTQLTAVVLLARQAASAADGDGDTLLNHMLLRELLSSRPAPRPNVLVELLDADNVDLARRAGADDVIVSAALVSGLMTQLADEPERRPILLRLYRPGGPSLRLVRASELGLLGDVRRDAVVAAAYRDGLLAIGWRTAAGIRLNPPASERVHLDGDDRIVAIG